MAKSSQVLPIERREGVSMAEVVMDDMAIGNPASLLTLAVALWASFPGIHIAQIPFQVIGNCGVIFPVQCSNHPGQTPWRDRVGVSGQTCMVLRLGFSWELHMELLVGGVRNMTVSWRRRLASISGAAGGWIQ
jgi:hypothetical protein